MVAERKRLKENKKRVHYWKQWGPYLAERQWGTVREDYSEDGDAWSAFPFEESHTRAYRWGEDGIAGLSDTHQRLCFALSFWNECDPLLKERLYGLANREGNHGEDVKECYYYLDNTPTHSYMEYLYKYPHAPYPYDEMRQGNHGRTQAEGEYELIDTGIFDHNRYFDIFVEYAKESEIDIYIRIKVCNRGNEEKRLHILPTLWARNTWFNGGEKPQLKANGERSIEAYHPELGTYTLYSSQVDELLFTENESAGYGKYTKEAFHEYVVNGKPESVNPNKEGTKGAFHVVCSIPPGGEEVLYLRLTQEKEQSKPLAHAEKVFRQRKKEADEFYESILPKSIGDDHFRIARQALAGMLWNKMFYHYIVPDWLKGDEEFNPKLPPHLSENTRNRDWLQVYCNDIISAPDCWEFPAFFSWDLAFHTIPLAMMDPEFAKNQLSLLVQEWYMHPNGQLPAYEWNFCDVNPPVHAWAAYRVFKIEAKKLGVEDRDFLEKVFQKLLLNFTWWVNRKDTLGKNIFQGGFLGLDNISVFNRSEHLPNGAELYQSDATSWMAMYCLNMLAITLELAHADSNYEDMANKFYNHFLLISDAINYVEKDSHPLWNEEDGFYYDVLKLADGSEKPLKVRSLVGLMPLLAVATIAPETIEKLPSFKKKMHWFFDHRGDLCSRVACMKTPGVKGRRILAILDKIKLEKLLRLMLDEEEFLSPYGIRSISKYHEQNPYQLQVDGKVYSVDYEPGESQNRLFGGNSNWRGPVWFPINVLIIESLQKFHHYYGDDFKVECPVGSGEMKTLWEVAAEISNRLLRLFERDSEGKRPVFGNREKLQNDPHFQDHLLFHEYFHGDTGQGLGASHQTGWTGFIAKLIKQLGEYNHI